MKKLTGFGVLMIFIASAAIAPVNAESKVETIAERSAIPQVDYAGFMALTEELSGYREQRLVDLDQFRKLAQRDDAIILDTRSAAAYQAGHIEGAINLPFSEFTDAKLANVIGDQNRPVLIYCNNNFRDDIPPVPLKRAPLALNIPTFINLYGYGYTNIYELAGTTHLADPRLAWTGIASPSVMD